MPLIRPIFSNNFLKAVGEAGSASSQHAAAIRLVAHALVMLSSDDLTHEIPFLMALPEVQSENLSLHLSPSFGWRVVAERMTALKEADTVTVVFNVDASGNPSATIRAHRKDVVIFSLAIFLKNGVIAIEHP